MKQFKHIMLAVFCGLLCSAALSSCGDDDKDEPKPAENTSGTPQELIIGKWVCSKDAYGDPWDGPIICQFYSDATGYRWFSDEPFSDRWEFTYTLTASRLDIITEYGSAYNLRYEISGDGKRLVIYGWDNNDMSELHFVKQ